MSIIDKARHYLSATFLDWGVRINPHPFIRHCMSQGLMVGMAMMDEGLKKAEEYEEDGEVDTPYIN